MKVRNLNMPRNLDCLCVNAGSSSLKLVLYRVEPDRSTRRRVAGTAREIGRSGAAVEVEGNREALPLANHVEALWALLKRMKLPAMDAIGHRLVHGGEHIHTQPMTPELLKDLQRATPLAPLHLPPALACIEALDQEFPKLPQVACFDTAFHAELPEVAHTLPLPERYRNKGLRRYGFHGLSYDYIRDRLGARTLGRVVIAHLGNGASLSAMRDGQPLDTTMGFTPSGGIMMGTRTGDIDPGVLLYLLREEKLDLTELERVIDQESGLLGVSGISADVATLLDQTEQPQARLALELFAHQVRKAIGSFAAVLGGLDRLVFTGGIGEQAATVRLAICSNLEFLGIDLDWAANTANAPVITTPDSKCTVEIIPTDEDAMIARHVYRLLCVERVGK
jgi:acetate kinase